MEKELGNVCIYGENHYSVIMANFLMSEYNLISCSTETSLMTLKYYNHKINFIIMNENIILVTKNYM